jgi:hypothetical protein
MIVECEYCKRNILNKKAYEIMTGICEDGPNFSNGCGTLKEIKGDGMFCSLMCIQKWLIKMLMEPVKPAIKTIRKELKCPKK